MSSFSDRLRGGQCSRFTPRTSDLRKSKRSHFLDIADEQDAAACAFPGIAGDGAALIQRTRAGTEINALDLERR